MESRRAAAWAARTDGSGPLEPYANSTRVHPLSSCARTMRSRYRRSNGAVVGAWVSDALLVVAMPRKSTGMVAPVVVVGGGLSGARGHQVGRGRRRAGQTPRLRQQGEGADAVEGVVRRRGDQQVLGTGHALERGQKGRDLPRGADDPRVD